MARLWHSAQVADYRDVNRANWDERVPAHLASPEYSVERFYADPGFLSGVGGAGSLAVPVRVGVFALSTAVNVAVFLLAFRLGTADAVRTRDLLLSAVVSAVVWQALLALGGLLVTHQVRHSHKNRQGREKS